MDRQTFPAPLEYDADAGLLKVHQSAFQWGTMDWWRAAQQTDASDVASVVDGWNIATVLSRTSHTTGSYAATNAFGVGKQVFRSTLKTESIFDRRGDSEDADMFAVGQGEVVGEIALSASEAKISKPRIRFALVIEPKWPFFVSGSDLKSGPSFSDPREVTEDYELIFADVMCGLVVDQGKVMAAFPTKDHIAPPGRIRGLFVE